MFSRQDRCLCPVNNYAGKKTGFSYSRELTTGRKSRHPKGNPVTARWAMQLAGLCTMQGLVCSSLTWEVTWHNWEKPKATAASGRSWCNLEQQRSSATCIRWRTDPERHGVSIKMKPLGSLHWLDSSESCNTKALEMCVVKSPAMGWAFSSPSEAATEEDISVQCQEPQQCKQCFHSAQKY